MKKQLPLDNSRCNNMSCPIRDSCMRSIEPETGRFVLSTFVYEDGKCYQYINKEDYENL